MCIRDRVQFGTAGASNLFLTMGYLKTISKELDDAAKIDGCSFFSTWWRVILPLSKPILATVALMTFRASWNNYLLPNLMLARDQAATTLVVAVVKLQSSGGAGASQYLSLIHILTIISSRAAAELTQQLRNFHAIVSLLPCLNSNDSNVPGACQDRKKFFGFLRKSMHKVCGN